MTMMMMVVDDHNHNNQVTTITTSRLSLAQQIDLYPSSMTELNSIFFHLQIKITSDDNFINILFQSLNIFMF